MNVYVLPVSGGRFPNQMGFMSMLMENFPPDLILASSGGNAASYLCLAANWEIERLEMLIEFVRSDLLIPPGFRLLPWTILRGKTQTLDDFFQYYFTDDQVTKTEIWSGTYNLTRQKTHLFCNLRQSKSVLRQAHFDRTKFNCLPNTYLAGNVNMILKASLASAAIPFYLPEVHINGEWYVDGGTSYASPLVPLEDSLSEILKDKPYRMFYLNSDMDRILTKPITSAISGGISLLNAHLDSTKLIDLSIGPSMLSKLSNGKDLKYLDGNQDNFQKTIEMIKNADRSYVEISSTTNNSLNLLNFTSQDVRKMYTDSQKNFKLKSWRVDG